MKKYIICCYLLWAFLGIKAQTTFTIPDQNFFNAILATGVATDASNQPVNCSTCVVNYTTREVNIACLDALNITNLSVSSKSITNLGGIQYFADLLNLFCDYNQLTSLPTLPNSINWLVCSSNELTSIPVLPSSLKNLNCYNNQLTSLPTLPSSLKNLNCYNNQLTSLPTLPSSLQVLNCDFNKLTSLPALPNSLTYLDCSYNQLTSLPVLPNSLKNLDCYNNQLTSLPALPNSLQNLDCYTNQLTSLPSLPNSLQNLGCYSNQLTSLPTLPNSLTGLGCYSNQLTSLPTLPDSLQNLDCSSNPLTSLPALPNSLQILYCGNNPLTSLPALPNSLQILYCDNNPLTSLPTLPNSLINLHCDNDPLTSLPSLPNSLTGLSCSSNQFTSLPSLPNSLTYLYCSSNQLTSLPTLPNSLINLDCYSNQLTSLPTLPNTIEYLDCSSNQLTNLPTLPNSLINLTCSSNQLTSLPILPNTIEYLDCSSNQLTSLPILPNTLIELYSNNNPLFCIPNIPNNLQTIDYANTYITCFPNYNAYIYSLPLCNQTNTPLPCRGLSALGMSENFPPTEMRKIVQNETLYLPFTSPAIDIIDYEIAIFDKTPTQKDTLAIFGGDIILGNLTQLATLYNATPTATVWEGKVPYNPVGISDSIRKAIMYFNVRAALMGLHIAFVPKEVGDTDFVTFVHSPKTFASYVGKIGGNQPIYVDINGFSGKILHEMTHVLGIYHEHQRWIAQNYIDIHSNAIRPEFADAFCRIHDLQTTPYDYGSVMQYVCFAFSSMPPLDGVNLGFSINTITPKATQIMENVEMGQRADYTNYDIEDINDLYPDGIIGGAINPATGQGSFTLLLPSYPNVNSVSWDIYNTEPIGNDSVTLVSASVNGYQATVNVPLQAANAPRAARGFVVATVTLSNGQQKKFYKYVYRN